MGKVAGAMVMQYTGSIILLAFGGATFAGVSQMVDTIFPPVGIKIHEIKYSPSDSPDIMQDRTVTAENKLTASFETIVYSSKFGELSKVCEGSGYWDYTSGRVTVSIPFDEWVGSDGCFDSLEDGVRHVACAEWRWSDGDRAEMCTIGFMKNE